jgi:surfeit locus 1 family protein
MRFRPLFWPTVMALPTLAVLIGLGTWQLERREWKLGLIAEMEVRLHEPPRPVMELAQMAREGRSIAYRRAEAKGRFNGARELFWFTPGPEGEPGYHLIVPLRLEAGGVLLVDRGFIPAALKDPALRPQSRLQGPVRIDGIVRDSQKPGPFTPADAPAESLVFARDVPQMAGLLGLTDVLPFFVEADAALNPGGYPIGGQTQVTLRNEHLQYALTWFGLAAALVIVYLLYHRKNGRLG